jgi:hypothetical protein
MKRPAGGGCKRARVRDLVGVEEASDQGQKSGKDVEEEEEAKTGEDVEEEEEAKLLGAYRRICSSPSVRAV